MFGWFSADAAWGFALKAGECIRVTGNVFGQEFEGDKTIQPCVLSLIDNTHPAAPELLDDPVVRDGLADHGGTQELMVPC